MPSSWDVQYINLASICRAFHNIKLVHFGTQPLKISINNIQKHTIIIHYYNLTKLVY